MHYLKSDISELTLVIQVCKSSNTCQKVLLLKIVVIHKLPTLMHLYLTISFIKMYCVLSLGGYTFPQVDGS